MARALRGVDEAHRLYKLEFTCNKRHFAVHHIGVYVQSFGPGLVLGQYRRRQCNIGAPCEEPVRNPLVRIPLA